MKTHKATKYHKLETTEWDLRFQILEWAEKIYNNTCIMLIKRGTKKYMRDYKNDQIDLNKTKDKVFIGEK